MLSAFSDLSKALETKRVSLDYSDYLRIREKSRLLGWLWMIGDRGYYLGLVGAALTLSFAFAIVLTVGVGRLVDPGDERALKFSPLLPLCGIAFPILLGIWWMSGCLKEIAHRRSGINEG